MPTRDSQLDFDALSALAREHGCPRCIRCVRRWTANLAGVCAKCLALKASKKAKCQRTRRKLKARTAAPRAKRPTCTRCNDRKMELGDIGVCSMCAWEMADLKAKIRSGELVVVH